MAEKDTKAGKITISDIYSLDIEDRNFILKKKTVTARNAIRYDILGYFSSMESVLKKILRDHLCDSVKEPIDLKGLRELILNSHKYIEDICVQLKL